MRDNPYRDTVVNLRRMGPTEWQMFVMVDDSVVNHAVFNGDEASAISRAETLADWLSAELKLHNIGETK